MTAPSEHANRQTRTLNTDPMFTIQIFYSQAGRATLRVFDNPNVGGNPVLLIEGPTALVLKTLDEYLRTMTGVTV